MKKIWKFETFFLHFVFASPVSFSLSLFYFDKWLIFRWEFHIKAARSRTLALIFICFYLEIWIFSLFFWDYYRRVMPLSRGRARESGDDNRKYNLLFFCSAITAIIHKIHFSRDKRINTNSLVGCSCRWVHISERRTARENGQFVGGGGQQKCNLKQLWSNRARQSNIRRRNYCQRRRRHKNENE